ncbi:MAG: amidohydrolase family protein [Infirmifilum sp.]
MAYVFKGCSYVLSPNGLLRDVDLSVGEDGTVHLGGELKGEEKIDCRGLLVAHGLANAHTHLSHYSAPASAASGLSWRSHHVELLPEEYARNIVLLALIKALETGTTLIADTTPYPETLSRLAREVGIRYLPVVRLGSSHVEVAASYLIEDLEALEDVAEHPEPLKEEGRSRLFIHVANDRESVFQFRRKTGKFPIEFLYSKGILGPWAILVAPGWVTSWEAELISQTGAKVLLAPIASLNQAQGGVLPHLMLQARGVQPGLCSESPMLGLSINMLEQARAYYLYQRGFFEYSDFTIEHAYTAATRGGYSALEVEGGEIRDGAKADLVFFDLDSVPPKASLGGLEQVFFNLDEGSVKYVVINGRMVFSPERREELLDIKTSLREKLMDMH